MSSHRASSLAINRVIAAASTACFVFVASLSAAFFPCMRKIGRIHLSSSSSSSNANVENTCLSISPLTSDRPFRYIICNVPAISLPSSSCIGTSASYIFCKSSLDRTGPTRSPIASTCATCVRFHASMIQLSPRSRLSRISSKRTFVSHGNLPLLKGAGMSIPSCKANTLALPVDESSFFSFFDLGSFVPALSFSSSFSSTGDPTVESRLTT